MPREIDCPKCNGTGRVHKHTVGLKIAENKFSWVKCQNHDCKNGKIIVYTQEELDEAVIIAVAKNNITFTDMVKALKNKLETLFTQEDIDKVVKDEREACVLVCESIFEIEGEMITLNYKCSEAIRKRSK